MSRPRLTYANVMATVALFLALGGGAVAATSLPAKSVGTKQLKAGAVTAAKIRNGTITGAKVDAATLGTVPSAQTAGRAGLAAMAERAGRATEADHAASANNATEAAHAASASKAAEADHAANADALGGIPYVQYVTNSQVAFIDRVFNGCSISVICAEEVLALGGIKFKAICENAAGVSGIVIQVTGATRTGYGYATGGNEARNGTFEGTGNVILASTPSTEAKTSTGTIVARNNSRVVGLSVSATARAPTVNTAACTIQATALAA